MTSIEVHAVIIIFVVSSSRLWVSLLDALPLVLLTCGHSLRADIEVTVVFYAFFSLLFTIIVKASLPR